jgi:CopG family transcriptional regulator, nickel-responsive regulator
VAAFVYVYDHAKRELSKRLTHTLHDHHDLSVATMHIHLDRESCLEVTVPKGGPIKCAISPTRLSLSEA